MKLTKEEKRIFIERHDRWLGEGLVGNLLGKLFTQAVKRELGKDKDFMKSLEDADKALARVDSNLKSLQKKGYDIPPALRRYMK
jgi:hypothetical protein